VLSIQEELDNAAADSEISLPSGEYEGPFYIRKPCRVSGGPTTLWACRGPVVAVESQGVSLSGLRIEVTGDPSDRPGFVALRTASGDTRLSDVEALGAIDGFAHSGAWRVPRVLRLGEFAPHTENLFTLQVYVEEDTEIIHGIAGLDVSPLRLGAGMNQIRLKTDRLNDNTILFGELVFRSFVSRRVYLSGKCVRGGADCSAGKAIFSDEPPASGAAAGPGAQAGSPFGPHPGTTGAADGAAAGPDASHIIMPSEIIAPDVSGSDAAALARGQRISINEYAAAEFKIVFEQRGIHAPMEIDAYVFMLGPGNKVFDDSGLIFFGNTESADHSVRCLSAGGRPAIVFLPARVSPKFERISMAYSIYGNDTNNNFSKIAEPSVRILINGHDRYRFSLAGATSETTLIAVEFYRYKGEWKMGAVGAGYRDGLRALCESFGVEIED
jgi:stress response protein SCP2